MKALHTTGLRWIEPTVLAVLSIAGLVCALLTDGLAETLGNLMLTMPLLAAARHLARAAHRKQEPE